MNEIAAHIVVPHDHPSLAGHFPGHPIVPGVVLLDCVLDAIRSRAGSPIGLASIVSTKFLQAVAPESRIDLRITFTSETGTTAAAGQWKARFTATLAGAPVLEGSFLLASQSEPGDNG